MNKKKLENFLWLTFISLGIIFIIVGLVLYFAIFNYKNKIDTIEKNSKPTDNDLINYCK